MDLTAPHLEQALHQLVLDSCNVQVELPTDLTFKEPLIGPNSPYGLDSLDAVEIVVAIQRFSGVRIGPEDRRAMRSITTLAELIRRQAKP